MKTLMKNAKLLNGDICDILMVDDIIHEISYSIKEQADQVIDLQGLHYVSSGWIDVHTHCFKKYELYGDDIDSIGYPNGVCTVVDAGTAGSDTIDEFYEQSKHAKTHVLCFMNIAKQGISAQNELADLANLDPVAFQAKLKQYPDFIIGLKARMSRSVLQSSGNQPLDIARILSDQVNLPIMVHIGNEPAKLEDVLQRLHPGDIVTHIFNPKKNGILDADKKIKTRVREAHEQGVYFDLGHGSESFSFETCREAFKQGLTCDSISTDIYFHNRIHGPVYSLSLTMSKLLEVGYSLEEVIQCVTTAPAKMIKRPELGELKVGGSANLTIFQLEEGEYQAEDSRKERVILHRLIQPIAVVLDGNYIDISKEKANEE